MVKKAEKNLSSSQSEKYLSEVHDHVTASKDWLDTRREEWDELEAMLIVKLKDDLSNAANSKVFDPRLSTIVYERAARVMGQPHKGKAFAVSRDDVGKNILMNMTLDYYRKNANEQFRFDTKLRMMDVYSMVYGSSFAMVPWRVNTKQGYVGPELNLLKMRDSFPQPYKQVRDADWFTVRNVVTVNWIKEQFATFPDTWMNKDELIQDIQAVKNDTDATSFVEREYYPTVVSDVVYPFVELFTEYRRGEWITWTPQKRADSSRPLVLRVVKDAYPEYKLPIVVKHAFPLIDSPIGIGEFARGKTLQYAINSLINLYMDGVKYSIFPPLHINPDGVVTSSIKWGIGEKWFMNNPNVDVQTMNITPQGMNTFQSTYSFLVNALINQSGTTDVVTGGNQEFTLGKSPAAVQDRVNRQSSRDSWDLAMLDDTINDIYERWICLITNKQEVDLDLRLFGTEIKELSKIYPDIAEVYESGDRGRIKIKKDMYASKYDYVLEPGSTYQVDPDKEAVDLTNLLKSLLENPQILELAKAQGKEINFGELFSRWVKTKVRDADNIVKDVAPEQMVESNQQMPSPMQPGMEQMAGQIPGIEGLMQQQMPQAGEEAGFNDPDIQEAMLASQELMGGMSGIPNA